MVRGVLGTISLLLVAWLIGVTLREFATPMAFYPAEAAFEIIPLIVAAAVAWCWLWRAPLSTALISGGAAVALTAWWTAAGDRTRYFTAAQWTIVGTVAAGIAAWRLLSTPR